MLGRAGAAGPALCGAARDAGEEGGSSLIARETFLAEQLHLGSRRRTALRASIRAIFSTCIDPLGPAAPRFGRTIRWL